jgi:hypothetical protein
MTITVRVERLWNQVWRRVRQLREGDSSTERPSIQATPLAVRRPSSPKGLRGDL